MNRFILLILTSFLLGFVHCDLPQTIVSGYKAGCPSDFMTRCDLQCANGNYVLDENDCPTCACAAACPEIKCRANCGDAGYVRDENGCQTCKCVGKVQCPRTMCRMYCQYGFKRDENGCEYCSCNQSPQECPKLNCEGSCSNGYRKDYSGCQTCDCEDQPRGGDGDCPEFACNLDCKYGHQRDENGCRTCTCNRCPLGLCRMFCTYGFRTNEDGCEVCECDWTPIEDKIPCDERIRCEGTSVCNLNLRLCEKVSPDRVNWFVYDFEEENELFKDAQFIQTFKNGLINNIATKYGLQSGQITVSSVIGNGLTSFQIMPFYDEDMVAFNNKIDQIDEDLNSHEFRAVLPAVVRVTEEDNDTPATPVGPMTRWCERFRKLIRTKSIFITMLVIIALIAIIIGMGYVNMRRRYQKLSICSDSKTQICGTSYHLASSDDDLHDFGTSDGFKQIIVTNDDQPIFNDKRALV